MLLFIVRLPVVFLIPIFGVRRYNGSYLSFTFIAFNFQRPRANFKILPQVARKRFFEQKIS